MISKEVFVATMKRLEMLDHKMDDVDNALQKLSSDGCGLFIPESTNIAIDLLCEVFSDKEECLKYLAYERNWLKSYKLGDVKIGDVPIDLSTWDKVYDFLIKNEPV